MRTLILVLFFSVSAPAIPHQRGYATAERLLYALRGGPHQLTFESVEHRRGRISIEQVSEFIVRVGKGYADVIIDPDFMHIMEALNRSHWIERSSYLPSLKPVREALMRVTRLQEIESEFVQQQKAIEQSEKGLTFAREVEIATSCFLSNHVWALIVERELSDLNGSRRAIYGALRNETLSLGQLNYRIASDKEFRNDVERLRAQEVILSSILQHTGRESVEHLQQTLTRLQREKRLAFGTRMIWGIPGLLLIPVTLDAIYSAPTTEWFIANAATVSLLAIPIAHKYREAYRLSTTPLEHVEIALRRSAEKCQKLF